jgi:hypothetical protein
VHLTGVYLMGVHLIDVYLTDVHLIGVCFIHRCLIGVYLVGVYPQECTSLRVPHWYVRYGHAHHWMHLIGVYIMGGGEITV